MPKRVLVTSRSFGEVSPAPLELLQEKGFEVVRSEKKGLLTEEEFRQLLPKFDALIIGADKLTENVMASAKGLRIVCKHGTGLDNLDIEAAKAQGILITNVPAVNADAVADVTIGLMLDVSRKLSRAAAAVRGGGWEKVIGQNVYGKRLGIIGFGKIGQKVARRALGFDMQISAYDPLNQQLPQGLERVTMRDFPSVLSQSDILTLHIPLLETTRNCIAAPQMEQMCQGAILINTARGGLLHEADLYRYLKNGHLGGAGLDVTQTEPPTGSPLLALDNVVILPHMASYSRESLNEISLVCARNIIALFEGHPVQYSVTQ